MEISDIWIGIIVPIIVGPICAYLMTIRNDYIEQKYRRRREKYEENRDSIYNALKNFYWPVYLNLIYIEQYSYQLPIKNKFRYESGSSLDTSDKSNDYFEDENNDNTASTNKIDESVNFIPRVTELDLDKIENISEKNNTDIEIRTDSSSDNYEISIDMPSNKDDENIKMTISEDKKNKRKNSKHFNEEKSRRKTIILDKNTLNTFKDNLNQKYCELVSIIEENMVLICIHQNLNMELIKFMKYAKVREIIQEGSPDREYNIEYFGVENNLRDLIHIIKQILDELNTNYTKLINNPI
jgi:hypothetical protein